MKTMKLVPLTAVALASVACGGHGTSSATRAAVDASGQVPGGSTSVHASVNASTKPSSAGSGHVGSLGGGAALSGTRPGSAPSQFGPTPSPTGPAPHREIPLDATLSATCVTPGGSETLTIHGDPGWRVVFDTRYPDGKDGQVYGGIDYRGSVGPAGSYTYTWAVSPAAPLGAGDVEAAAVGDGVTAHKRLPLTIALHCA